MLRPGNEGRGAEGIFEPIAQVAIGKQIEAQHGGQIGQRPVGLGQVMEPLEEQQGQQGGPNLDVQRILAGADEALDFQILLEGLEEQLDLPAVFVDVGDGRGPEVEVIGQRARSRAAFASSQTTTRRS